MTRSFDELESLYRALPPAPGDGALRSICLRVGGGVHETPARAVVTVDGGLEGDRWAATRHKTRDSQITLMNSEVARLVAAEVVPPHQAGDNFFVDIDLSEDALAAGARVRVGEVLLEVTAKPHLGCKKFEARFGAEALRWVNHEAHLFRRLRGVNCRVLEGGAVAVGDAVRVVD